KVWLQSLGLRHVEISDGNVELPRERKLEMIADFARDFTVLSEVGSKDSSVEYTAEQWVQWLQEELDAGAWKVITEARESGTAGIFDSSGGMRTELIGEIAMAVGPANVLFEAPSKAAQVWFIKQFGPSVNLGNIPPDDVIPLPNLRARDADRCCPLRNVEPCEPALAPYEAWITGIRREQALTRAETKRIEWSERYGVWKVHPVVDWDAKRIQAYIHVNEIPYNPLHDAGYPSIGCIPCTRPVVAGEDERAGRWAGSDKLECGIHGNTRLVKESND